MVKREHVKSTDLMIKFYTNIIIHLYEVKYTGER